MTKRHANTHFYSFHPSPPLSLPFDGGIKKKGKNGGKSRTKKKKKENKISKKIRKRQREREANIIEEGWVGWVMLSYTVVVLYIFGVFFFWCSLIWCGLFTSQMQEHSRQPQRQRPMQTKRPRLLRRRRYLQDRTRACAAAVAQRPRQGARPSQRSSPAAGRGKPAR